ncbi:MAG TPA: DMT family transporter [Bacillota bacterium]
MKRIFSAADLLLLVTTFIWGWSFIIVKWSMTVIDPYFFIFARFTIALLFLVTIFEAKLKNQLRTCIIPGFILGLVLAMAFITQTLGLRSTTASVSSFITGLNVVLVAGFASLTRRKLPPVPVLIGIGTATVGMLLITFRGPLAFQRGDLFTLTCAVLFAWHIVLTEKYAPSHSVTALTLVQFATAALLAGLVFLFWGHQRLPLVKFTGWHWAAILYSALPATALAYLFQTKAQQKIPPFRTAIIMATEPLFAGIFAISLRFDPFDWKVVAGGILIVAGMILAAWDVRESS